MQKELGRYLFSVFLEKRKIDRHLKNIHLKAHKEYFYLIHCLGWATGLTIVLLNAHLCFLEIFEHFFAENVCVSPYNPVQL